MCLTPRLALILTVPALLLGCAHAGTQVVPTTPVVVVAPPTPAPQLPLYPTQAEVVPVAISTELPAPAARQDPVAQAVAESRAHFDKGFGLYDTGFMGQAREEFDLALDVLLDTAYAYPGEERLRRELLDLTGRIHEMEMEAVRN